MLLSRMFGDGKALTASRDHGFWGNDCLAIMEQTPQKHKA